MNVLGFPTSHFVSRVLRRPFCRALCPTVALLGRFRRAAMWALQHDDTKLLTRNPFR
jgi:polyferredoxin